MNNDSYQKVLAIETSCDDTSIAIVGDGGVVFQVVSANQDLVHEPFGGIVPEIASRNHTLQVLPLIEACFEKAKLSWKDIDGIAVTSRPGLMGSLIVGVVTAKTLALLHEVPFIGVNHLEGHLLAPFLKDNSWQPPKNFDFPYLALAVSGGHSQFYRVEAHGMYQVLGRTLDDAAGEAFDKFSKLIGLGFPGGPMVDKMAVSGNPFAYNFPRALIHEKNLMLSFSGLKTAAQQVIESLDEANLKAQVSDLCASYQKAIVDVLISKLNWGMKDQGLTRAVITGGVSANSLLRLEVNNWAQKNNFQAVIPPVRYCTDNAAMIGYAGLLGLQRGEKSPQNLSPSPRSYDSDFLSGDSR